MFKRCLLGPVLLFWLLVASQVSRAEPLYPLLRLAEFDSLRTQLRQSSPDTNRVRLLLQLSTDIMERSEQQMADFHSALPYCNEALTLSKTLHFAAGHIGSLFALGHYHILLQDTTGRRLLRQGLRLSQQQQRWHLAAVGWYQLGNSYPFSGPYLPTVLACYQRAKDLFRRAGERREAAYMLKSMADLHLQQGKAAQAEGELLQVVAQYQAIGYPQLHYTYDLLQVVNRQMGNYKEALRYGRAAIERAQATHDTSAVEIFYSRVASLYVEVGEPGKGLGYAQKALRNYQILKNPEGIILMAGETAKILVKLGRPQQALELYVSATHPVSLQNHMAHAQYLADLYVATKHYPQAEQQYLKALSISNKLHTYDIYKGTINLALGKFYLLTRRYNEARQYLQPAQELWQRMGVVLSLAQTHLLLFKVDSAQAQFPSAIAHYQRYKVLTDSVFNERKTKQLASLEIQYDTKKKEQNITLLTKQAQAQQTRIRQREFQRNALVIGALLLAGLLGLGYNRYRLKQRSNQLLETQQAEINRQNVSLQHLLTEKDWMLKEIHHRVKNNLEVISSLLETQSDYLHDPVALTALREGQNRVHAMALIHQKLYQSHSLSVVDMAAYIREIAEHLVESFDCQDTVQLHLNVAPIELEVTVATPLGLIINEALTNALKYACPHPRPGNISIALLAFDTQHFQLVIEDDGAGFPPGFDMEDGRTMGLSIMRGLSGQIDGKLRITQTPGVRVSLDFEAVNSAAPARIG
jgi:two-component sensor histidine kinase